MTTMDSEVEIEVEFEVDLTGREDKVNVEVGVTFKLNLVFCIMQLSFGKGFCTCLLLAGEVDIPC